MDAIKLNNWCFGSGHNLVGELPDGHRVMTSKIVARNPEMNIVQTKSGTRYELGTIDRRSKPESEIWDERGWIGGAEIPRIIE